MKTWTAFPLTPTRFSLPAAYDAVTGVKTADDCALFIGNQPKVGWRFVVLCDGDYSQVGAIYKTKAEILADLARYASTWAKEWA